MRNLVDIHTHLTHGDFSPDLPQVIARAEDAGLAAIVVNGLGPTSNRQILKLSQSYPVIKPALGIYPTHAVAHLLPQDFPHELERFDCDDEIAFIEQEIAAGRASAVGECGLDGYWLGPETFPEQERVFGRLVDIAIKYDVPVIIHSRKCEARVIEILKEKGARRVNMHCFGGKVKMALATATENRWWYSIPANARRNEAFAKMLRDLPLDRILTETDAPWLGPEPGTRNEPANVRGTVAFFGELRQWPYDQAAAQVWKNFRELFSIKE